MATPRSFNEVSATQAAALLIKLRQNEGKMSYMKLIKLLYLGDRECLIRFGSSITSDRYVSMDKGPVLSRVLARINEGASPDEDSFWVRHITPCGSYEVKLVKDPGDDRLSLAQQEVLREVFQNWGHFSRWEIVDEVHKLPEWKNPRGSAIPIEIRDILGFANKTPAEIAKIEEDLEVADEFEALFGQ